MVFIGEFLEWITFHSGAWVYDGMTWMRFWSYH